VIHWDFGKSLAFRLHLDRRGKGWSLSRYVGEVDGIGFGGSDEVESPVGQWLFACGDEAGSVLDAVRVLAG
jgi:hypothetical protein